MMQWREFYRFYNASYQWFNYDFRNIQFRPSTDIIQFIFSVSRLISDDDLSMAEFLTENYTELFGQGTASRNYSKTYLFGFSNGYIQIIPFLSGNSYPSIEMLRILVSKKKRLINILIYKIHLL